MDETSVRCLDLRGIVCPINAARALIELKKLAPGALLELVIDDGEPIRNVPHSLMQQGHVEVDRQRSGDAWRLVIKKAANAGHV